MSEELGYCVTCPKCGRIHQKSISTESIIVCNRCGFKYYVFLNKGITFEMPATNAEDEKSLERLRKYLLALNSQSGESL